MKSHLLTSSATIFIGFILMGILLFIITRVIRILLPRLVQNSQRRQYYLHHFSSFEIVLWALFLMMYLPTFYGMNIYYGLGYSILVFYVYFWLGQFAIKDITAGFIVRANPAISKEKSIILDGKKIFIEKLGFIHITAKLQNGDIQFIPYSTFMGKTIDFITEKETTLYKTFIIETSNAIELESVKISIKNFILALPYCSIKHEPKIRKIETLDSSYKLEITFYALNSDHLSDIENEIHKEFGI